MMSGALEDIVAGRFRKTLLVVLILASSLSMAVAWILTPSGIDWPSFSLNLATEVIGIGVTVFGVDFLIRRAHEVEKLPAANETKERIQELMETALERLIAGLNWGDRIDNAPILAEAIKQRRRFEDVLRERYRVVAQQIIGEAAEQIRGFTLLDWTYLVRALTEIRDQSRVTLGVCAGLMTPKQFQAISRLERLAHQLVAGCSAIESLVKIQPPGDNTDLTMGTPRALAALAKHCRETMESAP